VLRDVSSWPPKADIPTASTSVRFAGQKRQLSASIAHEINQPITGMVLKASAALRWVAAEKPDLERIRTILADIVDAGHRAGDIITGVRAMFRKDSNTKRPINLNNLVNTVLALLRVDLQKDNVRVETQLDSELPAVTGDPVQLPQFGGQRRRRDARAATACFENQTSRSASGKAYLSIEDSGPGISASNRERIFDPLFTTKPGGMGMGLSICRSIIENHDGRISV
jgi:signal transduction histidine kinase